jgi:hypothetical protein
MVLSLGTHSDEKTYVCYLSLCRCHITVYISCMQSLHFTLVIWILCTRPLLSPGFVKQIMAYLCNLFYNGSLVT